MKDVRSMINPVNCAQCDVIIDEANYSQAFECDQCESVVCEACTSWCMSCDVIECLACSSSKQLTKHSKCVLTNT